MEPNKDGVQRPPERQGSIPPAPYTPPPYGATNTNNTIQSQPQPSNNTPATTVSNGLVWVQAFVPLIGVAFAFGGLVLFLLNVVLCYADEKQLKKQGYSIDGLGAAWLVPVYLYKREKMFPQGKGYFLVWCISFVLSFF